MGDLCERMNAYSDKYILLRQTCHHHVTDESWSLQVIHHCGNMKVTASQADTLHTAVTL